VLEAASSVDAGLVASEFTEPSKIKIAIFEARLKAVKQALQTSA
jgi:hypothetical protein